MPLIELVLAQNVDTLARCLRVREEVFTIEKGVPKDNDRSDRAAIATSVTSAFTGADVLYCRKRLRSDLEKVCRKLPSRSVSESPG